MKRDRLAEVRNERNLTQKQAAEAIGISEVYLRKLEAGDVSPGRNAMVSIERFYKVSVKELFPDIFLPSRDNNIITNH